jgi:hypothetical protein
MWKLINLIKRIQGQRLSTKIFRCFLAFIPLVFFQLFWSIGILLKVIFDFLAHGRMWNNWLEYEELETIKRPLFTFYSELRSIYYEVPYKYENNCVDELKLDDDEYFKVHGQ